MHYGEFKPTSKYDKYFSGYLTNKINSLLTTNENKHKLEHKVGGGNAFNFNSNYELITSIRKNNQLLSSIRLTERARNPSDHSRRNTGTAQQGQTVEASSRKSNLNVLSKIVLGQGLMLNSAQKAQSSKESLQNLGSLVGKLRSLGKYDKAKPIPHNSKRNLQDFSHTNPLDPLEFSSSVDTNSNKLSFVNRNSKQPIISESSLNTNRNSLNKNKSSLISLNPDSEKKVSKRFNKNLSLKEKMTSINPANAALSNSNSILEDLAYCSNGNSSNIPPLQGLCTISPKRAKPASAYMSKKFNWKTQKSTLTTNNTNVNANYINNEDMSDILNFSNNNTAQLDSNYNSIPTSFDAKPITAISAKKSSQNFPQLIAKVKQHNNYLRLNERPISSTIKFSLNKPIQSNIRPSNQFYIPNLNYNFNSSYKSSFIKEKTLRPFSHIQHMTSLHTRPDQEFSNSNYYSYNSSNLNEYSSETNQLLQLPTSANANQLQCPTSATREGPLLTQRKQKPSNAKMMPSLTLDNKDSSNDNRFITRNNISFNPTDNPLSSCSVTQKKAYLTKMAKMDDENFKKIIQIVDKLDKSKRHAENEPLKPNKAHYTQSNSIETLGSSPSPNRTTQVRENDKLAINYIKADAISFGNININYNNHYSIGNERPSEVSDAIRTSLSSLSMRILSNWGHKHQIGLTRIEVYDDKGVLVPIRVINVTNGDEGNVAVLVNGENNVIDEEQMWQSSYSPVQSATIQLSLYFEATIEAASIIIWNFNGRELSKGIRDVELFKDGTVIWKGTIRRGVHNSKEDYSTTIPLSSPKQLQPHQEDDISAHKQASINEMNIEDEYINSINSARNEIRSHLLDSVRPQSEYERIISNTTIKPNKAQPDVLDLPDYSGKVIWCHKIRIILSSNHGHRKYIGLTGIQFLNEKNSLINIEQASSIGAMPKDISTYYSDNEDCRIFENAFNGINLTNEDNQMWLTVIKPNEPLPYFELVFDNLIGIAAIKVWNYNVVNELDKGVRTIELFFDDTVSSCPYHETVFLHKGIGVSHVDYSQLITFPINRKVYTEKELEPFMNIKYASFLYNQCYETPYLPTGFVLKIALASAWGDSEFIGLNGLEVYDQLGRDLLHKRGKWHCKYRVVASPSEFNSTEETDTSQIESIIQSKSGWHTAFYSHHKGGSKENAIYFFFQSPITISYIQILNYTLIPSRGVKDVKIYLDNDVIFAGQLNKAETKEGGKSSNETIILFTCDISLTKHLNEDLLSKPISNVNYSITKSDQLIALSYD